MVVKFVLVFALLGALLILAIQNSQPIPINFLIWRSVSTSILVIILAGVLVGLLCGFFLGWSPRRRETQDQNDEPPR